MSIEKEISVVGYKADEKAESGYVSQVFTTVISVDEKTVKKLEEGAPLPDEFKPKLEKGWVDSPEKITKKPKYEFKPARDLGGIKVVG